MAEKIPEPTYYTADDLRMFDAEGKRYEILESILVERPMTNKIHGRIAARFVQIVLNYLDEHPLGEVYGGEVTYVLEGTRKKIISAVLPDASFIRAERLGETDDFDFVYIAPDIAVEIISPSERPGEVAKKVRTYLKFGVQQVWTIYPERQIVTVYHADGEIFDYGIEDTLACGVLLPDLQFETARLLS